MVSEHLLCMLHVVKGFAYHRSASSGKLALSPSGNLIHQLLSLLLEVLPCEDSALQPGQVFSFQGNKVPQIAVPGYYNWSSDSTLGPIVYAPSWCRTLSVLIPIHHGALCQLSQHPVGKPRTSLYTGF